MDTTTSDIDPVQFVAALQPSIEAGRDDGDAHGLLPTTLRHTLRDAGVFRLLTPREYGGLEAPLTTVLAVYEHLARIDASVGWLAWNANFGFATALLPESAARRIFRDDQEPIFCNAGTPSVAERVDTGYRLTGHWRMVSGAHTADWLMAMAIVTADGATIHTEDGDPRLWIAAVPREQFHVTSTWEGNALRATRSDDVIVTAVDVPPDMIAPIDQPSRINRALYRGFLPALVFPGCSAVAIGVAQSALDELAHLVQVKDARSGGRVAEAPRTQYTIAKAQAALDAARLLLMDTARSLQSSAQRNEPVVVEQRTALRSAMTHAAEVSRDTLVSMYSLAGSTALYRTNRVEQIFRDGMATTLHANHSANFLEMAGRVRLGLDPGLPLF